MSIRKHAIDAAKAVGLNAASSIITTTLKPFTDRLPSLILQTVEFENHTIGIILRYLWNHARTLPFGMRQYGTSHAYVAPLGRKTMVEYERFGTAQTFLFRGAPLFMSQETANHATSNTISYFRGTIDIEKLLTDAVDEYNAFLDGSKSSRRFEIVRYHGFGKSSSNEEGRVEKSRSYLDDPSDDDDNDFYTQRPLRWNIEDLKLPVPEAPFAHLMYAPEVSTYIQSIDLWLKSKDWFKERTIPWRMSGLLKGPPGTGKTSFVRAAAQKFDLPIHVLDLASMSNSDLITNWQKATSKAPCIILIEDIDRIFDESKNIAHSSAMSAFEGGITLDCLLNCISGVDTQDGVLLLVTANHVDRLDAALTRPGRLDHHVFFGALDDSGREAVAARILSGFESHIPALVAAGKDETGAEFERRCQGYSLALFWEQKTGMKLALPVEPPIAPVISLLPVKKVRKRRHR